MNIEKTSNEEEITLKVEGRIDTITSTELQNAIISAFQASNKVVIDLAEVRYVASSGLRAFLIGHKTAATKSGYMKLRHVSDPVMDILSTVGFDKIFMIE